MTNPADGVAPDAAPSPEPDAAPPTEPDAAPSRRSRRTRERTRGRQALVVALSALTVLVVGFVAIAAVLAARLNANVERFADPFEALTSRPEMPTPTAAPGEPAPSGTAMNFLLLGSDSRISAGDPGDWQYGAQRTDAIMLVHVPADSSAVYIMSIPRDSWVDIPDHGTAKINAAYSFGGPTLLIETFEQLTNVRIDHLALADFESFVALTDAVGGVELTLRRDLVDGGALILPAGDHLLSGDQALVYVRQRKNLARGDFDRVQRQQAWVRAVVKQALTREVLTDPGKLTAFLDTATRAVAVDEGFGISTMIDLAGRMSGLRSEDVRFFTVPIQGIGTSADGQSIVLLDREPFDELMEAVRHDDVDGFLATRGDSVDQLPDVAP